MYVPSYALTREQLHRKLATIDKGLPRRVRKHAPGREAEVWDKLFGTEPVVVHQWPRYEQIFDDAEERGRCWFLLDGSVDEWRSAIRAAVRGPGALIGEVPMIEPLKDSRGSRFGAQVRTREPVKALAIMREHLLAVLDESPLLCRSILSYVADHAAEYLNDHGQFDEALDQYFPSNNGWLLPAPYDVRKARMRIFFCRATKDPVAQLRLPPGLTFYLGIPVYMLVLIDMQDIRSVYPPTARSFSYNEVSVFVPVRVPGLALPRFHVPYMYPDNIMAVYLGREIFGLPKLRSSNFSDDLLDGSKRFLMRRGSTNVLEAHYHELPEREQWRNLYDNPPQDFRDALQRVTGAMADPFDTLFGQLASLVSERSDSLTIAADASLNVLPSWLKKVRTTSWKRIFDPHTTLRHKEGWDPSQFAVDGIVETPFNIHRILDFKVLRLVDDHIHAPEKYFPTAPLELLLPFGMEMSVQMTLEGGRQLLDYTGHHRRLARKYPERMVWAPDPNVDQGLE